MNTTNNHLPECDATDCGCEDGEECGPRCRHFCICNQLTAAEQRGRTQGEKEAGQALAAAVWDNPLHEQGRADERERIVTYLRDETQHPSIEAGAWAYGFAEVIESDSFNGAAQTSSTDAASLLSAAPLLPTSVAPAGEDYGALIGRMITKQDDRYGYDVRDGLWMCRDCGAIVKHGWLSMHDGLHDAIGYPVYPDVEEES